MKFRDGERDAVGPTVPPHGVVALLYIAAEFCAVRTVPLRDSHPAGAGILLFAIGPIFTSFVTLIADIFLNIVLGVVGSLLLLNN